MFIENCESVSMTTLLGEANRKLKVALLENELEINGIKSRITTSRTGNGGYRYWFTCPKCDDRCGKLFRSPVNSKLIACRKCLNLKYKSQYKD